MAKRALCIGVSYEEAFANFPNYQLHSALDDVDKFKDFLISTIHSACELLPCSLCALPARFEYAEEDITIFKDDGSNTDPTYDNMARAHVQRYVNLQLISSLQLEAMSNLVSSASEGDHLVFYCELLSLTLGSKF